MPAPVRVDAFLLAGQFPGVSHARALHDALSYALAAERAGFDGVWIAGHHFISYGACPSALTFAAHLLGRTTRIRVGTAACILSNRHPVALAEEAILLDELSGGRLDLGVARGGPWIDLDVFGTGLHRYQHGFAEALDLLLAWLSGAETVGADGEFFQFPPVAVVPAAHRPVPVWVAATGEHTAALAATRRLPLLLGMHATPDDKRRLIDHYGQATRGLPHASAVGHASAHVAYVADTLTQAQHALRAAMPGWLSTTAQYLRIDPPPELGPPATRAPTWSTCWTSTRSDHHSCACAGWPTPWPPPACAGCCLWSKALATTRPPWPTSPGSAPTSCHTCAPEPAAVMQEVAAVVEPSGDFDEASRPMPTIAFENGFRFR